MLVLFLWKSILVIDRSVTVWKNQPVWSEILCGVVGDSDSKQQIVRKKQKQEFHSSEKQCL